MIMIPTAKSLNVELTFYITLESFFGRGEGVKGRGSHILCVWPIINYYEKTSHLIGLILDGKKTRGQFPIEIDTQILHDVYKVKLSTKGGGGG